MHLLPKGGHKLQNGSSGRHGEEKHLRNGPVIAEDDMAAAKTLKTSGNRKVTYTEARGLLGVKIQVKLGNIPSEAAPQTIEISAGEDCCRGKLSVEA